jgi:DNA adenine methylase
MVNPILKWAGGKRQLIPEIINLFPNDYKQRTYHEPFFGSGAVFFKIKPKKGSINDINSRLMKFYKIVRDKPEELIKEAGKYPYHKSTYYKLRDHFNNGELNPVEEAALLLYFNKTGFNGLYRENSKGQFNVPFGRYKNPTIVPENKIRKASKILKNIEILNQDFSYVQEYVEPGDLCYFDPPYQPVSDTANFTSYFADGFELDDQIKLLNTCIELNEKEVYFVLSNSYVEPIIEMYEPVEDFRIVPVEARRSINSKANNRGPVKESLITNIPEYRKLEFYLNNQRLSY